MKRYKKFPVFCLLSLFLLSLVRYSDNVDYRLIDILSHFPFQYALSALVLLLSCLRKKNIILVLSSLFLFLFNASALIDSGQSIQAAGQSKADFKVYSANIFKLNKDLSKLSHELKEKNAEIVLLLEVTPDHLKQLTSIIKTYPYHLELTPIENNVGIVLLSKFPILDHFVMQLSEFGNAVLNATLEINNKKVTFYGAHLQHSVIVDNFFDRQHQFIDLAYQVRRTPMPVIVAGDLNATPYSPIFRELIKLSGLKDSREGFGWQPSWPTFVPLMWIPIDHILVSPEIHVHNRATGSFIGSDHYPVFAELSID